MSNKKHIDRIFQESFKDFEATPNPKLWAKIQNDLPVVTKSPKTAFPVWMRIISVAAVLVVLITIGLNVLTKTSTPEILDTETVDTKIQIDTNLPKAGAVEVVSEENSVLKNSEFTAEDPRSLKDTSGINRGAVTEADENTDKSLVASDGVAGALNTTSAAAKNYKVASNQNNSSENTEQAATNQSGNLSENQNLKTPNTHKVASGIASQNRISSSNTDEMVNQAEINNGLKTATLVAQQTLQLGVNADEKSENKIDGISNKGGVSAVISEQNSVENAVANTHNNTTQTRSNNNSSNNNNSNKNNTIKNNNTVALTINSANESTKTASDDQRAVSTSETDNMLKEISAQNTIAWNAKSGNIPQNEKEKEETLIVGDSLVSESPSIEEAIAQAEETSETEADEKLVNRWQVQANIAPVYYNSLGKGSHIDDEFVSNSKSGETNTSYGVNVSYAISKKLAIRSGISSLNLSYDTDNVILYNSPTTTVPSQTNPLRNITLAPGSATLSAFSGDNLGFQQINNELFNAAISQRLSYYEVPVELEYKLVNNRFGVHIIGGMSTFFLNDNEVYSEFEEFKTYIGEANNVNSVSFSTNLGIGLNYKFTDKLLFNFEPTFKYQLNGFDNTSGNFQPYIIGVYTGFSYKF